MPRRKNGAGSVGDIVFYKWKGEALPAIIVNLVSDSTIAGVADLNVFTRNGVMVVTRVMPGAGDAQYNRSGTPPVTVDEPEVVPED